MTDDKDPTPSPPPPSTDDIPTGSLGDSKPQTPTIDLDTVDTGDPGSTADLPEME